MSCYMIRRFFFFKQKTAYEMRISDWSSDVCSSDLATAGRTAAGRQAPPYPLGRAAAPRAAARRLRETGASYRPAAVDIVDLAGRIGRQIGRASCRERGCQYVEISVVDVSFKKKQKYTKHNITHKHNKQ